MGLGGASDGPRNVASGWRFPSRMARAAIASILLLAFEAAAPIGPPVSFTAFGSQTIVGLAVQADPNELHVVPGRSSVGGAIETAPLHPTEVVVEDASPNIRYGGSWSSQVHPRYIGRHVRSSNEDGAWASLTFTGLAISWIGPTGPTRGRARVYIDGRFVRTVDTYSARFNPSRVLFSATYATERRRTLQIVVVGTKGRPTVAIDVLAVRSGQTPALKAPDDPGPLPTAFLTPALGAASTTSPSAASTTSPSALPTMSPSALPTMSPSALPTMSPSAAKSVHVSSIVALMAALADNSVDEIVVADGTYHVSSASDQASDSLWIGSQFASRSRPVIVRAATRGGVTFDGGGETWGGLGFSGGSHDQTWDGFQFANGVTDSSGVIVFGGYPGLAAPHDITLRNITLASSCHRTPGNTAQDHGIYFSYAVGGPHDLLIENLKVDGTDQLGLWSAIHLDHGDATNMASHNVTIRGLTVTGTQDAIILWTPTTHDWLIDGATISNAAGQAVRFESVGASNITFKNIVSTGSGSGGFYSSMGANPPGVTFINDSFH